MIKASTALAAIGASITVSMEVSVDGAPMTLRLQAKVCHNNKATYEPVYFIGMAFQNVSREDKLVLHYLTQTPQG
jgi:hypothetical protein